MMQDGNEMKNSYVLIPILGLFATWAQADYLMPAFAVALQNATHVVDADVIEITKEGHAVIRVRENIKGQDAPKTLIGARLTCTPETPPRDFGVREKKRYLFILSGNKLYEEGTFYEITPGKEGVEFCRIGERSKGWIGVEEESLPRQVFLDLIKSHLATAVKK
jgi:hypothetical protein